MITLIINDESAVNDRGYRLLNSGLDRSRYDKNPVMLHQHDVEQIIGHCTSLYISGSKLMGTFEFDDDALSRDIEHKAMNGSLKGVSASFYVRNTENRPEGEFVTEWELLEVSLVTLPSNPNAVKLSSTYGLNLTPEEASGKIMQLSASMLPIEQNNLTHMITLTKENLTALGLPDEPTQEECNEAVQRIVAERNELSARLEELHAQEGERLINEALKAGKVPEGAKEVYTKLYQLDSALCTKLLDVMLSTPTPRTLTEQLQSAQSETTDKYAPGWDELDRKGLLASLKAEDPDRFEAKFQEKFHPSL